MGYASLAAIPVQLAQTIKFASRVSLAIYLPMLVYSHVVRLHISTIKL